MLSQIVYLHAFSSFWQNSICQIVIPSPSFGSKMCRKLAEESEKDTNTISLDYTWELTENRKRLMSKKQDIRKRARKTESLSPKSGSFASLYTAFTCC